MLTKVIVILATTASIASAQICNGSPSFSRGPVRIAGGGSFFDGGRSLGIQIAAGSSKFYGGGGISNVDYDDIEETGTVFGLHGGASVPLGAKGTAEFCPEAGFSRQTGPNFETTSGPWEYTARELYFGGVLGGVVSASPTFEFIPSAGAYFVSSKGTGTLNGVESWAKETFVNATVGAGFVLNRTLTLQPMISFPIGQEDGDPMFSISIAFNFGSPRP